MIDDLSTSLQGRVVIQRSSEVRVVTVEGSRKKTFQARSAFRTRYGHHIIPVICFIRPLPEGKRRLIDIANCFKEGFGRCVNAKRKGRNETTIKRGSSLSPITIGMDLPKQA
ncbi:hypothetical protein Tco_0965555 [Tanacetum coccineum]